MIHTLVAETCRRLRCL